MQKQWETAEGKVDAERFGSFSRRPIPAPYPQPPHDLEYYEKLRGQTFDHGKWRCAGIP